MTISDNAKFSFLRHLYDEMLVVFREQITQKLEIFLSPVWRGFRGLFSLLYLLLRKAVINYKIRLENKSLQTRRIFL